MLRKYFTVVYMNKKFVCQYELPVFDPYVAPNLLYCMNTYFLLTYTTFDIEPLFVLNRGRTMPCVSCVVPKDKFTAFSVYKL